MSKSVLLTLYSVLTRGIRREVLSQGEAPEPELEPRQRALRDVLQAARAVTPQRLMVRAPPGRVTRLKKSEHLQMPYCSLGGSYISYRALCLQSVPYEVLPGCLSQLRPGSRALR